MNFFKITLAGTMCAVAFTCAPIKALEVPQYVKEGLTLAAAALVLNTAAATCDKGLFDWNAEAGFGAAIKYGFMMGITAATAIADIFLLKAALLLDVKKNNPTTLLDTKE